MMVMRPAAQIGLKHSGTGVALSGAVPKRGDDPWPSDPGRVPGRRLQVGPGGSKGTHT